MALFVLDNCLAIDDIGIVGHSAIVHFLGDVKLKVVIGVDEQGVFAGGGKVAVAVGGGTAQVGGMGDDLDLGLAMGVLLKYAAHDSYAIVG